MRTLDVPDFTILAPPSSDPDKKETPNSFVSATQSRISDFFDQEAALAIARREAAQSETEVERKANLWYGLALDKCIKVGLGVDSSKFVVPDPWKPLGLDEHRYFAEVETPVVGVTRRACVENVVTGDRRLELPYNFVGPYLDEPTLYTCADRCSKGRPLIDFFQIAPQPKMRTVGNYDTWHILEGFLKKNFSRRCLTSKRFEATIGYRAFCGPHMSASFWNQFQTLGKDVFGPNGKPDDVFDFTYPLICKQRKVPLHLRGSVGHKDSLFHTLGRSQCLTTMGVNPVNGRWGNFEAKHCAVKQDRGVILHVLIVMGILKKWWKDLASSPCQNLLKALDCYLEEDDDDDDASASELDDEEEDKAPVAAGVAVKRVTLEQSRKEINALRSSRKNTLDFTAWFYSDLLSLSRLDAVSFGNSVMAEFFSIWLTKHKTLWGHSDFYIGLASGSLSVVIAESWRLMGDPTVLDELDLVPDPHGKPGNLENDKVVLGDLYHTLIGLTADLALYEHEFTHSPYGLAPRLLVRNNDRQMAEDRFQHLAFQYSRLYFFAS